MICEIVFKILVWFKKNINEKGLGIVDDGNDLNELKMINLCIWLIVKLIIGWVFFLLDDSLMEREV